MSSPKPFENIVLGKSELTEKVPSVTHTHVVHDSKSSSNSFITIAYKVSHSQTAPVTLQLKASVSEQIAENKLTPGELSFFREVCERINNKNQTSLVGLCDKLEVLYKKDINCALEHIKIAIELNKSNIMMQIINCTPFEHSRNIKDLDALFFENSKHKFTLLQFAEQCKSDGCRFLLWHHGANSENMYNDPEWKKKSLTKAVKP